MLQLQLLKMFPGNTSIKVISNILEKPIFSVLLTYSGITENYDIKQELCVTLSVRLKLHTYF